ncbi:MAG: cupin domain-containing protein [Planctomycetota bacterium]|jgi:quercetin dioxygenase-like cupin family protein
MSTESGNQENVSECLGRARTLSDLVEYVSGSIVSKTIADKRVGTITVFAFERGQKLSEHQAPFDAVVQVVDGTAELTIGEESITVSQGQIIIMPANIPHSVSAEEKFKMLLTMLRA